MPVSDTWMVSLFDVCRTVFVTLKRWGTFESVAAILLPLCNIPDDFVTLAHGAVLTTLASLPHFIGACLMLSVFLTAKPDVSLTIQAQSTLDSLKASGRPANARTTSRLAC
jgi:hypothetical protein